MTSITDPTPFQRWQMEKYGNILPEQPSVCSGYSEDKTLEKLQLIQELTILEPHKYLHT